MKKLKNKTFLLLSIIFSIFIIILLIIFNTNVYSNEYKKIHDKIGFIENKHESDKRNENIAKTPMFFDTNVYVLLINERGQVRGIINYSEDGISNEEIINVFNKNIYKINNGSNSLYDRYLFFRTIKGDVIIIDNTATQSFLKLNIIQSFIAFILLEFLILFLSHKLTNWVTKPAIESFEKQKQFIYDASHELKTPISIILANAETSIENPKEIKWMNNVKSEAERMDKLVKDLLNLAKTDSIEERTLYQNNNLTKLTKTKALSFESLMYENDISLEMNTEDDIYLKSDADRIKELLSILIDNAIKHAKKKTIIEINLYKEKNNIILEVINEGNEIPENERTKIFERFYRIDKSRNRNQNSYGLGLSIAKNIVTNHNGTIYVECENGKTIFKTVFKQN